MWETIDITWPCLERNQFAPLGHAMGKERSKLITHVTERKGQHHCGFISQRISVVILKSRQICRQGKNSIYSHNCICWLHLSKIVLKKGFICFLLSFRLTTPATFLGQLKCIDLVMKTLTPKSHWHQSHINFHYVETELSVKQSKLKLLWAVRVVLHEYYLHIKETG